MKPPKDVAINTEYNGFCVLSCIQLHKELNRCKYCHKYIINEDEKKHLSQHRKEVFEEDTLCHACLNDQKFPPGTAMSELETSTEQITVSFDKLPIQNLSDSKISEPLDKSIIDNLKYDKKSIMEQESNEIQKLAGLPCIDNISSTSLASKKNDKIDKSFDSHISEVLSELSLKEIKKSVHSADVRLSKDSNEIKNERIETQRKGKKMKSVYDKLSRSWLKFY